MVSATSSPRLDWWACCRARVLPSSRRPSTLEHQIEVWCPSSPACSTRSTTRSMFCLALPGPTLTGGLPNLRCLTGSPLVFHPPSGYGSGGWGFESLAARTKPAQLRPHCAGRLARCRPSYLVRRRGVGRMACQAASSTTAPRIEPIMPLGRSASPSPLSRLISSPPTNDPARPTTSSSAQLIG